MDEDLEQQQKDWEREQELLDSESAKAIANNEAMIKEEHQGEMADKQDLLLTEIKKALEFAEFDGGLITLDNEDEIIKSILAKAEKYYAGKIEEAKERGLEAGAINERARIILAIDCLPMYKQFKEQYGNRPKDIIYSMALNLAKEQALKEGEL